jgi:hypothetical protein
MIFKNIDFLKYNEKWELDQKLKLKKPIVQNFYSYGELHDEIRNRTKRIPEHDTDLFEIVNLIHKWGGVTGRYFIMDRRDVGYFQRLKKDKVLISVYIQAAKMAIKGDPNSLSEFCKIPGIKESFGSKHAYFWSPPNMPLIIIDKILASYFGYKSPSELIRKLDGGYAKLIDVFTIEAKRKSLESILILERGIFQYMKEK